MGLKLSGKAQQRQRKREAPARQRQKQIAAAEAARWCWTCAAFGKAQLAAEGANGMCPECYASECADMGDADYYAVLAQQGV